METPDGNPFPEISLGVTDKIRSVAKNIIGLCTYRPPEVPLYMSDHYNKDHFEPTDGEAMLPADTGAEAMLYDLLEQGRKAKQAREQ